MSTLDIRAAEPADRNELLALYARVVEDGGAFPVSPPAADEDFERAWMRGKTAVLVAHKGERLSCAATLLQFDGLAQLSKFACYQGLGLVQAFQFRAIAERTAQCLLQPE